MKRIYSLLALAIFAIASYAQEGGHSTTEPGRKVTFVRNTTGDNWFVGAGIGGSLFFSDHSNNASLGSLATFQGSAFIGKWYNPFIGGRLSVGTGVLHAFNEGATEMRHMRQINAHVDAMFNATNFFLNYDTDRTYNLIPYLGVGYAHSFQNGWNRWKNNTFMFSGGLLNTFKLSDKFSAYAEIGGILVDDMFGGEEGGKWNWELIATGTVGIVFNFGGKTYFDECQPSYSQTEINELNQQVNLLRQQVAELSLRPENCPDCPEPQIIEEAVISNTEPEITPKPEIKRLPGEVFFAINSSKIEPDQEIYIANAAQFMKENPNSKMKVVGYADVETGNHAINIKLSEQRVKNVVKRLTERYGIDNSRISMDWKGDSVQPHAVNELNRFVAFLVE